MSCPHSHPHSHPLTHTHAHQTHVTLPRLSLSAGVPGELPAARGAAAGARLQRAAAPPVPRPRRPTAPRPPPPHPHRARPVDRGTDPLHASHWTRRACACAALLYRVCDDCPLTCVGTRAASGKRLPSPGLSKPLNVCIGFSFQIEPIGFMPGACPGARRGRHGSVPQHARNKGLGLVQGGMNLCSSCTKQETLTSLGWKRAPETGFLNSPVHA